MNFHTVKCEMALPTVLAVRYMLHGIDPKEASPDHPAAAAHALEMMREIAGQIPSRVKKVNLEIVADQSAWIYPAADAARIRSLARHGMNAGPALPAPAP